MSYTALYRKFRPLTFNEMVGQEHITKTLKNQIMAQRVGHAYLFNGGRGTGKTTAAKVLARAINCLNPQDGEPCNECEICKAALSGSLTDIVEMDAASNNSVEDIRSIREEVNFLPTVAKYRVYIIDEVHMLSPGAFNALLKTLEEPPAHVKFILATTEPQKLPATILSRCQRFDFKTISNENIEKRLQFVCDQSNIEITHEALKLIAILSEGAMRDALSILERCVQDGDNKIDENKIKDLVGIPKLTYIHQLVMSIIESNVEKTLETINDVVNEGKDLQNFLWEIIKYVKDVLVYKTSHKLEIYSQDEIKDIEELADKTDKDYLLEMIYALSNMENDIKYSSQKMILFQVGMIKLCNRQSFNKDDKESIHSASNVEMESLKNRVYQLEQKISGLKNNVDNSKNMQKLSTEPMKSVQKVEKEKRPIQKIQTGEKLETWPKIINDLKTSGKIMLYTNLMNSTASQINDMVIGIEFSNGLTPFGKTILEKNENIAELEKRVSMECGKPMKIKYIDSKVTTKEVEQSNPVETFAQDMDIPFNMYE